MIERENSEADGLRAARRLLDATRAAVRVSERLLDEVAEEPIDRQQVNLGRAFYQLGDYDSARQHLSAAFTLSRDPDVAIRLALSEWRSGDLEAARGWAEMAIELNPRGQFTALIAETTSTYCSVLAEIQLRQGYVESAEASAKAALAISPDDVAALMVLSTTRLAAGDGRGALALAQQALTASPEFLRSELESKVTAISSFADDELPVALNFADAMELAV